MEEIMAALSGGSRINTNISALNALNALNKVNAELGVHQIRLASGKKINSASDDASGYVISKKMEGRIRSLNAASDNVGDAMNLLSVAEGGYTTIADLLTQVKDKVTRFTNAGFSAAEKDALAAEIDQLASEIDQAATQTKFNGISVINGNFKSTITAAGTAGTVGTTITSNGHSMVVDSVDVSGAAASSTFTFTAGTNKVTVSDGTNSVDISTVGGLAAGAKKTFNFLNASVTMLGSSGTLTAQELADALTTKTVTSSAGTNPSWQVGEARTESFTVNLSTSVTSTSLLGSAGGTINSASITDTFKDSVDSAIGTVLGVIGNIGAQINRLQAKSDMLTTSVTNTEAAKSRILDADIAKEQISAVKLQVLQQTATAQLAQANQSPQVFLSLFR
jgi:flagellin